MSEVERFIADEFRKGLEAKLAEQPWWCLLCGEGGNYEGERPDDFWFPPTDHVCADRPWSPTGIFS